MDAKVFYFGSTLLLKIIIALRKLPQSIPLKGKAFLAHLKTPCNEKTVTYRPCGNYDRLGSAKEVQMDLTDVKLVKIDTIQRYPNNTEKILTWQDDNHLSYVTFVPMEAYYAIGPG